MMNPLPAGEIRELLGNRGFVRLYGQDTHLFVSDIPRRVSGDDLCSIREALVKRGYTAEEDPSALLLIDLQPSRWKALLESFTPDKPAGFPQDETLHGVYALARLLSHHPAAFERQPMELIRAALKRYEGKNGLPAIAPQIQAECAALLRQGKALPSSLFNIFYVWLSEQI